MSKRLLAVLLVGLTVALTALSSGSAQASIRVDPVRPTTGSPLDVHALAFDRYSRITARQRPASEQCYIRDRKAAMPAHVCQERQQ